MIIMIIHDNLLWSCGLIDKGEEKVATEVFRGRHLNTIMIDKLFDDFDGDNDNFDDS